MVFRQVCVALLSLAMMCSASFADQVTHRAANKKTAAAAKKPVKSAGVVRRAPQAKITVPSEETFGKENRFEAGPREGGFREEPCPDQPHTPCHLQLSFFEPRLRARSGLG